MELFSQVPWLSWLRLPKICSVKWEVRYTAERPRILGGELIEVRTNTGNEPQQQSDHLNCKHRIPIVFCYDTTTALMWRICPWLLHCFVWILPKRKALFTVYRLIMKHWPSIVSDSAYCVHNYIVGIPVTRHLFKPRRYRSATHVDSYLFD
jgi:hypothetical protein